MGIIKKIILLLVVVVGVFIFVNIVSGSSYNDCTIYGNCFEKDDAGNITYVTNEITGGLDGNASSICSGADQVLLGNGSCRTSSDFTTVGGGGAADGNASSICSGADQVLLGNGSCKTITDIGGDSDTQLKIDQTLNTTSNATFNNITLSDDSYGAGNFSIGKWFNGLFNWVINSTWSQYFSFDGQNFSVSNFANESWSSTYNETYEGSVNNASYLSTYNATYASYNTTLVASDLYVNKTGDTMTGDLVMQSVDLNISSGKLNLIKGSNVSSIYVDDAGNTIFT